MNKALAHRAGKLAEDDPKRLAVFRMEMDVLDAFKRIYTLSKRMARTVLPVELGGTLERFSEETAITYYEFPQFQFPITMEEDSMALDGIWTTEFHGQLGWENVGILVMLDGAVAGGNNNHFSHGSCTESGDAVKLTLMINFHGTPRTVFGEREEEFTLQLEGTRSGDTITGTYFRTDKPRMTLDFRATRRADFP